ncbi:G-protein coupled receptors family 1 profile domain-containing protein [Caenorhabditis elegans]|uniref:G-protein coupled receptors family 1 profile domain-containing protein n=1 Tax=Caenorhabditis elegans TaxID=6239 RepID=Q9XXJ9_CAEEL|nr:G-protein coupled receptors family 1 profile domain-containing protein [Caenorhabditis elegans]CAA19431.2 G-protein coupled receptors family 1 profile domain-containing protein [Caenorhabditis elegans]|eukprot:NP_001309436.1 Serpentine Receptor, class W [Caenorhabditis elegans]
MEYATFSITGVGVFTNIFHLAVLNNKSMRKFTINIFLIGIAISDLIRMNCKMFHTATKFYQLYQSHWGSCVPRSSYLLMAIINFCSPTGHIFGAHLGIWFAVGMAVIRVLVVKYPLSSRMNSLTKSKYGSRIVFFIVLCMLPFWIFDYFQVTVIPATLPSNCANFSVDSYQVQYILEETHIFDNERIYEINVFVQGLLFEFTPSIILPIATLLLVVEKRRARKSTELMKSVSNQNSSDRSTTLVIFMTITFVIATAPRGFSYVGKFIISQVGDDKPKLTLQSMIVGFIINFNSAIHFLLCYCLHNVFTISECGERIVQKRSRKDLGCYSVLYKYEIKYFERNWSLAGKYISILL